MPRLRVLSWTGLVALLGLVTGAPGQAGPAPGLPLLDQSAPSQVRTATFALG